MAKSGINHVVTSVPVPRSQYESEEHHALVSGTSFPAAPVEKQLFYRTDLHLLYIYNGTGWREASVSANYIAQAPEANLLVRSFTKGWTSGNLVKGAGVDVDPTEITADISCGVYMSANLSIANATWTTVPWDTEEWDTAAIHDNVTNNSRLTCPVAGRYLIWYTGQWTDNTTGARMVRVVLNAGGDFLKMFLDKDGDGRWIASTSGVFNLALNDYIELSVYQSSGAALVLGGLSDKSRFGMYRLPT